MAKRVFSSALVLVLFLGCADEGVENEKIIARVDGRAITQGRLNDALRALLPEGEEATDEEYLRELKRAILNELIVEELILGQAVRAGLTVGEEELSGEISILKEDYDDRDFEKAVLPRYGTVEAWRDDVRKKLLIRKVIDEVKASRIVITDEMAQAYYRENVDEYDIPEQVRARMILVGTKEEADEVTQRLESENFSDLAEELSTGPEAARGGDLGFFGRGEMPEEFEDVVFSLSEGEKSGIIHTPYGYHIFLVEEKKKGRKLGFGDVKDKIKDKLRAEETDMEYRKWLLALKDSAEIEIAEGF